IEYDCAERKAHSAQRKEERQAPGAVRWASTIKNFIRHFDLSRAPLVRVGLTPIENQSHLLMVDMHHIISDGLSIRILREELTTLYSLEELPRLRLQYKDYSEWQKKEENKARLAQQESYWLKEFTGEIPVLVLPYDYNRPPLQSFEGKTVSFEIGSRETNALKELAQKEGTTIYTVILAIFNVLLMKLSSQEDIVVGTPVAGRRHADLQSIVGMFVNTLTLRNYPFGQKSFTGFLNEVKEKTLGAFENQEYPFEELVDQLTVERDTSRNPLFDVMFAFGEAGIEEPDRTNAILNMKPFAHEKSTSQFDITLAAELLKEHLLFSLEYCTRLFKAETISRFIEYFKTVLGLIIESPGKKILELDIISGQEKRQLLSEFNNTKAEYPADKTIHELFTVQVERTPHHVALLDIQETHEKHHNTSHISYKELNQKSNQLAHLLRQKGLRADTIVGIMVERSIEMIIGIIGILKAGAAYLPIDPDYPQERKQYMLNDSGAKILLTGQEIAGLYSPQALYLSEGHHPIFPASLPSSLAYVIYTSGTTGKPKGVLVDHSSVIAYLHAFYQEFEITAGDTALQQASYSFDAFVEEVYPVLFRGGKVAICPKYVIMDTEALSRFILKHDITFISVSPLLLNEINQLSHTGSIRVFISGGDELKKEYITNLLQLKNSSVYNTYGPTEATVCATYYRCSHDGYANPPIGKPITNYQVYILDSYQQMVPIGVPGELYIGGKGVARGYLNRPDLTAEKFIFNPFACSEKVYRTGDLVRYLEDSVLEFLGRSDQQLKIRGFRIEPGEIENQLVSHKNIKQAVVISRELKDRYLCAYIVSDTHLETSEIREYLYKTLPDYMIPSYFLRLEKLPLNTSGKVDRKALPEPEIKTGKTYAAPRDEIESQLIEIWTGVLFGKNESEASQLIGIDDNFFELGGHSLIATRLTAKIHQEFDIRITLAEFFKKPYIRDLASHIQARRKKTGDTFISIEPAEKKEFYPLSPAQKRLFVIQQLEPRATTYNAPTVVRLEGKIYRDNFENSFKKLIQRHEILRTSFIILDGQPVQKISHHLEFAIEYYGLEPGTNSKESAANTIKNFIRPFELSQAPLLRVGLIKTKEDRYILMADMHHITTDAISTGILITDLVTFYQEEKLPKLKYQYKDFSQWQNNQILSGEMKKQEEYWLEQFKGKSPSLKIPFDFPRPTVRNNEGRTIGFEITPQETEKLKELAKKENATMFMLVLALFNVLLHKISYQDDIIVGAVLAGRRHADLANIIGIFVNTLVLRNFPAGERTFSEFLREVRKRTLEAFDNQDYQFEDLVEKLMIEREPGRNPLFDVLFTFASPDPPRPASKQPKKKKPLNLTIKPYGEKESAPIKFDLFFAGGEAGNTLSFSMQYSIELFKKETIEKFSKYFKEIVAAVVENEAVKLRDIKIIHDLRVASSDIYEDNKGVEFEF
ncbi:MAG: amino acid adenylation domain-containing protein, partial [Candidatus Aminicenantes bacterium]